MRVLPLALVAAVFALPGAVHSQELTLEEALDLARENNGSVVAAMLQYESSRAAARAAYAAFLPSITPTFTYETSRTRNYTGPFRGVFEGNESTSVLSASFLVLDSGFRDVNYRRSLLNRDITGQNALTTLRNVLFSIHTSFYNALRAEEIHRVNLAQLERAVEIEKQTREFAETGAGAKKDVLQATADMLNSKAAELSARNAVTTSKADLKAQIGVPQDRELDPLVAPPPMDVQFVDYTLAQAVQEGIENRPDLIAQRLRVEAQEQNVRQARIERGFQWSIEAIHTRAFSPDPFDHSALVFQVTVPLFDGGRTAENLRASRLDLRAEEATLTQSERDAIAEIESAYREFAQNIERLEAATAALEAAQLNYQAAFDSRREGAGELIEVLTAQVSLTTAESNYIEAYYDTLISRVRLLLVTGQPLPGESD
jgi:outer membrane protein